MGSRPAAENDEPHEKAAGGTDERGMPRRIIVILGALAPGIHAEALISAKSVQDGSIVLILQRFGMDPGSSPG
jgi:hypothetical protein